jgi:transcriptional regulator with XRE-family HTH domain
MTETVNEALADVIEKAAAAPGLRLRLERRVAGVTQERLAGAAGMAQPHLSRLERGGRAPRPGEVERLEALVALLAAEAGGAAAA